MHRGPQVEVVQELVGGDAAVVIALELDEHGRLEVRLDLLAEDLPASLQDLRCASRGPSRPARGGHMRRCTVDWKGLRCTGTDNPRITAQLYPKPSWWIAA